MQRIVNGGGYVLREYGVGKRAIDLLVRWPYTDENGRRAEQHEALELKTWRQEKPDPLDEGLAQLDRYLERLGLDRVVLVIFDERPDAAPIAERTVFGEAKIPSGRAVTLLRA